MTRFGWRTAFFLGGGLSFAAAVASLALLPESVQFLAARGMRPQEVVSILKRLRPDLGISAATRFVLPAEAAPTGLAVRQLFTQGRARMTILLWAAFITSLSSHYFLTNSLDHGAGDRWLARWPARSHPCLGQTPLKPAARCVLPCQLAFTRLDRVPIHSAHFAC